MLKEIEKQNVEYVLFWITDLEGHLKSPITPGEIEAALDDGMGFDGSSITGFNAIEESDMVAIPDPGTFRLAGARGEAIVGRMICDIVKPDGTPYEGDPRYMLRQALERMESMGFDTFNIGPELEYFLFQDDSGNGDARRGRLLRDDDDGRRDWLRNDTIKALEVDGDPIEYHHHEVAPSQHEIDMRYASALDMADHTITYRLIVKEVARRRATMRRSCRSRSSARTGRGCTPVALLDGRNQFFDENDPHHLSPTAKAFIAGLLRRARGSRPSSPSGSTPTSSSCRATRRMSTTPGLWEPLA